MSSNDCGKKKIYFVLFPFDFDRSIQYSIFVTGMANCRLGKFSGVFFD